YGDEGAFAESMTADTCGRLDVSLTLWGATEPATDSTGQVWQVKPSGRSRAIMTLDLTPDQMLMGITSDCVGRLYVACADFSGTAGPVIYRLAPRGEPTAIAVLPPGAWPNGLAIFGGGLYVSDSALGAIWRIPLSGGVATPTEPWYQSDLLAPGDPSVDPSVLGIGVNGIAFTSGTLWAVVSDYGRLMRIPVLRHHVPGSATVVCERSELRTADGMAVDAYGRLWIVTNTGPTQDEPGGALFRVYRTGAVSQAKVDPSRFDYPTQPVFGTADPYRTTLFIVNGAYSAAAAPTVIAVKVGVTARHVP
ncbi:MAG TPA: hypothetical protein VK576_04995, partial [Thermoleophilia bacterium]|nr:hypothetical protein [Thermoleophilia bacterium]